ncbi:hypothetical protein BC939DRAFT_441176 [Gamsiella multidivaricata]|uniref:uncharacterized protein n=1 Tax=Gamsiella multidivaricata TaxID=101098 RepID=UPI00222114C3|nr:uncharacterized protein BC939DRAFT_441176 [Gamsiella multidivaricata]KAG0370722.1 hypothetical protein BGZ54_004460 [Gamsiella multidivaricata]KAI7829592.1 hypothetical protein BC939DRAFT_441176 [Gamsiella multidivaricata]
MDLSAENDTKQQRQKDTDETRDEFPTEPPVWATNTSASQAQDLAPPPTYDPSAFSASVDALNALPTFKSRKPNRVSVLAYPTDGSQPSLPTKSTSTPPGGVSTLPAPIAQGGPPALFGSSGAGASTTPPPPSGGSPGIKLPPPPMKNPGNGPAPIPYNKDFRTAEIVNHWNDPPTQIFKKASQTEGAAAFDFVPMKETLATIIKECAANVPASQKRMFEDTTKRLQTLQEQMDNGTVKERIVAPLGEMIQALSSKSFTQCQAIHAKLMQTEFESEGKWLLGFKRLIDLYASLSSSS